MQPADHVLPALLRSRNAGLDCARKMAAVLQGTQQDKGPRLERLAIDSRTLPVNSQMHGARSRNPQTSRPFTPLQAHAGLRLGLIDTYQELIDRIAEVQQPQMRLQFECRVFVRT